MAEDDEVWSATVDDNTFKVTVLRAEEYNGTLTITHVPTEEVLLTQRVGLSYGAIFGPDVSDVAAWQVLALDTIDEWVKTHENN